MTAFQKPIFGIFDRAYCIHYPNQERRPIIEAEFKRVGIDGVEYVHASRPMPKFAPNNMRRNDRMEFACNMSHAKAIMLSMRDETPVFFEDDIRFVQDWESLLSHAIRDLPDDWDLLYLGGHPRGATEKVGECLYRVGLFSCAEAYAINGRQGDFLSYWFDRVTQNTAMFDFILGEFAEKNNAYAVFPTVTHQRDVKSQISGEVESKSNLIKKGWQQNT